MIENPLTEKDFQQLIIDHLVQDDHYEERSAKHDYNPAYAMDTELLFDFLERSQHDSVERLKEIYDGDYEATVLNSIDRAIKRQGLVQVLWDGVDFEGDVRLSLVEPRPSVLFDKRAADLYEDNVLSVMKEVWHKEDERIDLVIFLNGIAIFTIELKCNTSGTGWDVREAIRQYQEERDCTTRLLTPRVGAIAHFAMDLREVYVCSELKGKQSTFLPFNKGVREQGSTHETGPGNPHNPNGPDTAYMWEDILTKETIFDLIYDFVYVDGKRDKRGKVKRRTLIFPRYQQLRAVRRVSDDIRKSSIQRNYLIEHSAGSGKTNTICWLAHKLSGMFAEGSNDPLFDKVVIITDRRVVDHQLQHAVKEMAKDPAVVRVMSAKKTSEDLERALHSSYRIVVSTTQKFLYLKPGTFENTSKRFAVLIDEAHGSTSGKSMAAVDSVLAGGAKEDLSSLDEVGRFLSADIARSGKQPNMSVIGFTATPTGRTLQQFGTVNEKGQREAFDLYSMNQAIAEGFILDVTANYTTYDAYCRVLKAIKDDPELESATAKRKLAHLINVDPRTIEGKLEVMVEHFTNTVAQTLGGHAKAMIVTSSREAAVRYFLAYRELMRKDMRILGHTRALVAFTDQVVVDGHTYTEAGLNGMSEDRTADAFDNGDEYRLLIVADKFQTGFDQPRLAAMYVDKPLHGIAAVQTLSRLNRTCLPYDKRTFVLDFVNTFKGIQDAFRPYYKSTILTDPLTLSDVRETERRLLGYDVLDKDEVHEFNALLAKEKRTTRENDRMFALVETAAADVRKRDEETADEIRRTIRNFIRQYAFLLQVSPLTDTGMHEEYNFCVCLIRLLDAGTHGGINFDIADKVTLTDFNVEKGDEHEGEPLKAGPEIKIAKGTGTGFAPQTFEKLSRIIEEWNARWGTHFDPNALTPNVVALDNALAEDEKVVRSANVNTKSDFGNTINDRGMDVLVSSYDQNQEWYDFILNNEEARGELFSLLGNELYPRLRNKGA